MPMQKSQEGPSAEPQCQEEPRGLRELPCLWSGALRVFTEGRGSTSGTGFRTEALGPDSSCCELVRDLEEVD